MSLKAVCLLVILATLALPAAAQSGRDTAKEKRISDQLRSVAPAAVADFEAGTIAMDAEQNEEAIRHFQAVLQQAPKFDPAMRRLGYSLARVHRVTEGMDLLEAAVALNRSPENLLSLAQTMAYPSEGQQGSPEQKAAALALAKEADGMPKAGDDNAWDYKFLVAQLALELDRMGEFRAATAQLVEKYPDTMGTHYFNAILAAIDERWLTAENEIKKAESLGLPHEVAAQFLASGVHTRATVWRALIYIIIIVALWLTGLALLYLIGKFMSVRTMRSIESGEATSATSADISLRKWYRRLINLAGFYYYISLPVVIVLVILVAAAVTFAFSALGWIPVKLVGLLCIGALITIYKMIRSLFIKIDSEDAGRSLSYEEAPGLWELTKTVAGTVQTRPVDEIRITPGTDLAVYEKGSWRERANDKARRILLVGAGVLNDFDQNGFRAVLAHEYGHFSHRDTAGGDIAIRVTADMIKFAHAMALSGQAVSWNVAFQFLRVYHFIFRRISHGATRLQEVLADRVAAATYGAPAFESGLRHVVRKTVEFRYVATKEIDASTHARRALQNLYELQSGSNPDIEEEINDSLTRTTSDDDTHPSPVDRFRYTSRITTVGESPISGNVWDLFKDKEVLTRELTSLIQRQVS